MPRLGEPATIGSPRSKPREEVFGAVAEEVGRLLEVDFATVVRYDPQDAITIVGTWTRTGAPSPAPVGDRMPLGGRNLSTLVYQTGRPSQCLQAGRAPVRCSSQRRHLHLASRISRRTTPRSLAKPGLTERASAREIQLPY
jgi:hypothetical protein